jgi:hypothetical protein
LGFPPRRRRSSREVDRLRARALLGDPLGELSDSDREWVWRSLLTGVRVAQSAEVAGLERGQLEPALARLRTRYEHRIRSYKRSKSSHAEIPVPADTPKASGTWWRFRLA